MDFRVKSYNFNGIFSGEISYNNTKQFNVGGFDLGFPLFDAKRNKLFLLFGDTFRENNFKHDWRSNTMCEVKEVNDRGQILIDKFIIDKRNKAYALSEGHHKDKFEMTRIPTGAVEVNGIYYFYYFSMCSWKYEPDNRMNLGGLVKSTDQGKTWEKVNDVTFLNDLNKKSAKKILNEDNNFKKIKNLIDPESHLNHSFTQIFPYDGGDGYIYLFAEAGYRNNPLRLGRVKKGNIEVFSEYEYLVAYKDNKPIFQKGDKARLDTSNKLTPAILNAPCGEMSLIYNPYIKKYCIFIVTDKPTMDGEEDKGLYMFTSSSLTGPYDEHIKIVDFEDQTISISGMYAPMCHESFLKNGGKDIYLLLSQWLPLYNPITLHIQMENTK